MFGLPTILAALMVTATPQQNVDEVVLLEFTAPSDAVCIEFKPLIEKFKAQQYPIETIDVTHPDNQGITRNFQVRSYPTYVMLLGNTEIGRLEGRDLEQGLQGKILQLFDRARAEFTRINEQMMAASRPNDRTGNPGNSGSPGNLGGNGPRGFEDMRDDFRTRPDGLADRNSSAPQFSPATPDRRIAADASQTHGLNGQINGPMQSQGVLLESGTTPWMESSVRLRVLDPDGVSHGTGTIIDVRDGRALVVSCGHIFRNSKGKGKVEVYLNGINGPTKTEGECWYYNCVTADIGFVVIENAPASVRGIEMAPQNYDIRRGQNVVSVGCDGGAAPSVYKHTVISTDRIRDGNPNADFNFIQVTGAPVVGRSGGGLFSENGYLIGVCCAGDPQQNDGHFIPLEVVRSELLNAKFQVVLNSQSLSDPRATAVASRDRNQPGLTSPPQSDLGRELMGSTTPNRYVSLDELYRLQSEGAEIICVVKSNSGNQPREERYVLEPARERRR